MHVVATRTKGFGVISGEVLLAGACGSGDPGPRVIEAKLCHKMFDTLGSIAGGPRAAPGAGEGPGGTRPLSRALPLSRHRSENQGGPRRPRSHIFHISEEGLSGCKS
jgi:hypothetical protein